MKQQIQIGLGTAQLGVPYGNQSQAPLMSETEAFAILHSALAGGISFIDTAIAYGLSEERIGAFFRKFPDNRALISTKIPAVAREIWSSSKAYWEFLSQSLDASYARLGIETCKILQFHQCDLEFLESPEVQRNLGRLIEAGYCEKIGISVYAPEQARAALAVPCVSALQIPVNILDLRFVSPELQTLYREKNIFLIARSILLQGVLFANAPLPQVKKSPLLAQLRSIVSSKTDLQDLSRNAFRYIFGNLRDILDIALMGADSARGLDDNIEAIKLSSEPLSETESSNFDEARNFAHEFSLYNPALWNT